MPSIQSADNFSLQTPHPLPSQSKNRSSGATATPGSSFIDCSRHTEQLKRIQEQSIQRRQERLQQIHDLDLELARVTAKLSQATLQRQQEYKSVLSESLYIPLEKMVERLSLEKESSGSSSADSTRPQSRWMQLESRLSTMQTHMVYNLQVVTADKQKALFHRVEQDLQECIVPVVEQQKEKKQSRVLDTRIEQLAGMLKRHLLDERAARKAAIDMSAETIKSRQELDEKRGQEYLSKIQELRRTLARERFERQQQDEATQEKIHRAHVLLREALISSVDEKDDNEETILRLDQS